MDKARKAPIVFVRNGEWVPSPALLRTVSPREEARAAGRYSLGEVASLLAATVAVGLLLDSGGLVTWANRLPLGPPRTTILAALQPIDEALGVAGFARIRQSATDLSDRLGPTLEPVPEGEPTERIAILPVDACVAPFGTQEDDSLLAWEPEADPPRSPPLPGPPAATGVLLLGDSMMVAGLGPAISHALGRQGVEVVTDARESTGLARPDVFDWPAYATGLLEGHKPALVVVTFGANDFNDMQSGQKQLVGGSKSWDEEYRTRVHSMMTLLAADGRRVLWLGLPPMREERFDQRMARLSRLYAEEARKVPGVDFLDERKALAGTDGGFEAFHFYKDGTLLKMRMDDGVHLTIGGGEAAARGVLAWIRRSNGRLTDSSGDPEW